MIEIIEYDGATLALIVRSNFSKEGIEFFTPDTYSQQLAYMKRPSGYAISPHVHNPVHRDIQFTKEVLFIKSGRVRVDFYTDERVYLESRVLAAGDVLLLAFGGHGFQVLEEAEIFEVKQGPYAGEGDKTRFQPVGEHMLNLKE